MADYVYAADTWLTTDVSQGAGDGSSFANREAIPTDADNVTINLGVAGRIVRETSNGQLILGYGVNSGKTLLVIGSLITVTDANDNDNKSVTFTVEIGGTAGVKCLRFLHTSGTGEGYIRLSYCLLGRDGSDNRTFSNTCYWYGHTGMYFYKCNFIKEAGITGTYSWNSYGGTYFFDTCDFVMGNAYITSTIGAGVNIYLRDCTKSGAGAYIIYSGGGMNLYLIGTNPANYTGNGARWIYLNVAYRELTQGGSPVADIEVYARSDVMQLGFKGLTDVDGHIQTIIGSSDPNTGAEYTTEGMLCWWKLTPKGSSDVLYSDAGNSTTTEFSFFDPSGIYNYYDDARVMSSDWGSLGSEIDTPLTLAASYAPVITNPAISTASAPQLGEITITCDLTLAERAFVVFTDANDVPVYSKEMTLDADSATVTINTGLIPAAVYSAGQIEIIATNAAGNEADRDQTLAITITQAATPPSEIDYGLTFDKKKEIYDDIPTSFVVKSVTLPTAVRYSNQWEADIWPAIVLEYTTLTGNIFTPDNLVWYTSNEDTDEITYVTGTTIYALSLSAVKEIVSVIGVKSGGWWTFVEGTDYQLTGDTIEWLGADVPDNGALFYVRFKAKWARQLRGGEKFATLSVNVMAKDRKETGEAYLNGIIIADEIALQLHHYFEFQFEPPLGLVTVTEPDIRNLDNTTEGEYQRRRQFNVEIRYMERFETVVESIEETDTEVTIE